MKSAIVALLFFLVQASALQPGEYHRLGEIDPPPAYNPGYCPVMDDFNIRFVFEHPTFRPTIYSIVNDRVESQVRKELDRAFQYRLPNEMESLMGKKLPMHVETYFLNHRRTEEILSRTKEKVESESRRVLERVSNEDPYQNAVFGPFLNNLEQRSDKKLKETKEEALRKVDNIQTTQTWHTVGILGALGLAAFAAFGKRD
jgi:ElaB/YqjD/DUF883 family membrane-anchored ribosome-binding protein